MFWNSVFECGKFTKAAVAAARHARGIMNGRPENA